jgi:hypothetical protein
LSSGVSRSAAGRPLATVQAGVHVVVGSSGLTAGDYAELDRLARLLFGP